MKAIVSLALLAMVARTDAFMPRGYRCTKPLSVRSGMKVLKKVVLNVATEIPVEVEPENFKFESNVSRVMDIIINSLYSNKDVFIRELVSRIMMCSFAPTNTQFQLHKSMIYYMNLLTLCV